MEFNLEKCRERLKSRETLLLLVIFLLAFGVRAHVMSYEYMFGFDSYFHARIVSYVIQDGAVPEVDPLAYYYKPEGASIGNITPVFWYGTALIYNIFTLGTGYDKEVWIGFVKILPALFGALIAVAMYFFMKEAYGRKAGYVAALVAAVVPAFVYRTMAGFFEEDSLGFLWLIMGFYFFVKAVKPMEFNRETAANALIAAFFFVVMAWTWGMFLLVPIVLVSYFTLNLAMMALKKFKAKEIKAFAAVFAVMFVVFAVGATLKDQGEWAYRSYEYVSNYLPVSGENIERYQSKGPGILAQTVGEENLGADYFGNKYNALIFFPAAALLLIPLRVMRKKDVVSLMVFFYIAVTLFMAISKLKFTYTFGLPIAAAAGMVTVEFMEFSKGRGGLEKKLVLFGLGFLLLAGVASGSFFMSQQKPNIEENNGWKDALKWMKENTPEDASFLNWWDEGHWITFLGERKAALDNRNFDYQADREVGAFMIAEDENKAGELLEKFHPDYIILDSSSLTQMQSFAVYAFESVDPSNTSLQGYAGFAFGCGIQQNPLTMEKKVACGGNTFTEEEYVALPSTWKPMPNANFNPQVPAYMYRGEYETVLYILSPKSNKTMLARIWFNDPALEGFMEVYGQKGVKIFKAGQ